MKLRMQVLVGPSICGRVVTFNVASLLICFSIFQRCVWVRVQRNGLLCQSLYRVFA